MFPFILTHVHTNTQTLANNIPCGTYSLLISFAQVRPIVVLVYVLFLLVLRPVVPFSSKSVVLDYAHRSGDGVQRYAMGGTKRNSGRTAHSTNQTTPNGYKQPDTYAHTYLFALILIPHYAVRVVDPSLCTEVLTPHPRRPTDQHNLPHILTLARSSKALSTTTIHTRSVQWR